MLMRHVSDVDPELTQAIEQERRRQETTLELIASENLAHPAVFEAEGTVLMNKSAEGYPGKRYFGGCEWVDEVEALAIERGKRVFGSDHVNVQPHSGVNANLAVYLAALEPGDKVLALNLNQGGHLSHGFPLSLSGQVYEFHHYGLDRETERLDYDRIREQALKLRPRMIVTGASAYPREIDFQAFADIASDVDAYLLADIAHIAGLVAGGIHPSPVPHSHFVTHTTYKTMAGSRGGVIHCRDRFASAIDRAIFPGLQGTPTLQMVAGKAVTFRLALTPEFAEYQEQVVRNARVLAQALTERDFRLVSGGTDTHLMLVDLRNKGISGKEAQDTLEKAGIATNKNVIPYDPAKPTITSGIRLGTPTVTRRGFKEDEMRHVARLIADVLRAPTDDAVLERARHEALELTQSFPLFYD